MNLSTLIQNLSEEAAVPVLRRPGYYAVRLGGILLLYAAIMLPAQGIRADLASQFARPAFFTEVILLATMMLSSLLAAILCLYPDSYQRPGLLRLPYWLFAVTTLFIGYQFLQPTDLRMVIPPAAHTIECTLCIAALSLFPSALIFVLLRKGTSIHPWQAGSFAVLASASLGCLMLRLTEGNDSLLHLVRWHYAPTLLFAAIGACVGKYLLRW